MGDNLLMKTTILLLTLPLLALAQATRPDLKWVDDEVAAIKPPRKGVSPSSLGALKDPFRAQLLLNQPPAEPTDGKRPAPNVPEAPAERHTLSLQAVFNGKSALIDGKWYKQDQKVYGYVVREIGYDSVLLQSKKKKLKLSLYKHNDDIKINVK